MGDGEEQQPLTYPVYYKLYEHGRFHTVIMIPDLKAYFEVMMLRNHALNECRHQENGECISLKRVGFDEWLKTH